MKFLSNILVKAGLVVENTFSANAATNTIYAGTGTRLRTEANNLVFERVSSSGIMKMVFAQGTLSPSAKAYIGYSNATLNLILANEYATAGLELRTSDIIRQQIFANGNIVIGQASPVDAGYKVDITGTARVTGIFTGSDIRTGSHAFRDQMYITATTDGWTRQSAYNAASAFTLGFVGDLRFGYNTAVKAVFSFNGSYSNNGTIYFGDVSLMKIFTGDAFGNTTGATNANGYGVNLMPTLNYTTGTSNFTGYYYNPTLVSTTGLTHYAMNLVAGLVKVGDLSGTGTRMVVADSSGVLSTQAITAGITGSGSTGQLAYWNGSSSQAGTNNLFWDIANNRLGFNTTNPQRTVHIYNSVADNHLAISGPAPSVSLSDSVTGSTHQAKFGLATASGHYAASATAGDFVIISQTGSTIWMTSNVERLKLSYNGNFIVGGVNDTLLAKLQVVGAIQQSTVTSSVLKADANGVLVAATSGSDFVAPATLASYVPTSRTITINGVSYDLSADRSWSVTSMVYPGAGIAVSTGSSWGTSITDNSSNWNAAYSWGNHASAGYLTASSASSTYLTISNASSTYLTQSSANTIYLNKNDASSIYLSQSSANTIYLNKNDASSVYLSQSSASSIYLSIGNASSTYLSQSSAASTYVSLSGSYSNPSWITSLAWSKITGAPAFITGYTETDTLASVTGRGATTTSAITINRNTAGLTFNRDAVTNYTGIYYSTASTPRWFIGMRENLSSNNHIHYSEQLAADVLTLNVANGNATVLGEISTIVDSSGAAIKAQNNGTGARWYGRIGSFNSSSDKSSFIATYAGVAVVGAHNNALTAWAALHINNVDGSNGGQVYLPTNTYIASNVVLHAGNYSSYALPLSGGTLSGVLYFTDTTNGIYKSGGRLTVRSESTDNVANFANYGLYLPVMGQTAGLYVESPIEARGGLRIGSGASSGTINVGADTGVVGSRLVQRDANGYIYANHVNFNTTESENPTISSFITSNGDGWSRKSSLQHVRNQLGNYGGWITGYTETDTLATVTARGATTASGITFTAPGGSVLLKHAVSESDAWIFQENAANWGLYWKNAPSGHHTFGGYTTVGAELVGMSAANSSGNGVLTSNFVGATSAYAQWMISNFTGYIWSASTIYAAGAMRAYEFRGNANVAGTGEAVYAPAGLYSTGTNWLYGTMYLNGNSVNDAAYIGMIGANNTPINITGAAHKYLTINPGNGYEAMVRYIGGSGSSWYVGKRTSGQLVGTQSFHFYSEEAAATVGGINPSGDMMATGSMHAPIFYDSNNTSYYGDFASNSRFNGTVTNTSYFGADTNKGYANGYGTYSAQLHKIARITFDWDSNYDTENHGIFSTNLAGGYSDNMSINSYNDINLRIDSNDNDTASYVRFHQHTTGNNQFAYIGYNGSNYEAYFSGIVYGQSSMRAPIFYDSNDTSYYLDPNSTSRLYYIDAPQGYVSNGNPWGTANSSFHPNGITTAGSQNWIYGSTFIGNAPSNGSGVLISSNGSSYFRSSNTSGTWGYAGQFVDRSNAANNYVPWSFESEYGNHSWGIVARFHIQQSGADRPSIQFSSASSNSRWSVGYCYFDDNFRITQNQGYRIDGSAVSDGWGTERFRINTDGSAHVVSGGLTVNSNTTTGTSAGVVNLGTTGDPSSISNSSIIGLTWGLRGDSQAYYMVRSNSMTYGGYTYNRLDLSWHTGIVIGAATTYGGIRFWNNSTNIGSLIASIGDGDNNMRSTADIIAYASDKRLKENVTNIPNALDKVLKINGVYFDWKDKTKELGFHPSQKHDVGVIAQEIQAILPEVVTLAPFDYELGNSKSGENFLTVKYEKIVPLLIEAIKEQQIQIEELKGQLNGITK